MGDTTDGNSCVLGLLLSCECVCVHFWGKCFVFFFFLSPLLPGSTWQYIGCFRFCFLQGLVQHVAHSRELIHVVEWTDEFVGSFDEPLSKPGYAMLTYDPTSWTLLSREAAVSPAFQSLCWLLLQWVSAWSAGCQGGRQQDGCLHGGALSSQPPWRHDGSLHHGLALWSCVVLGGREKDWHLLSAHQAQGSAFGATHTLRCLAVTIPPWSYCF